MSRLRYTNIQIAIASMRTLQYVFIYIVFDTRQVRRMERHLAQSMNTTAQGPPCHEHWISPQYVFWRAVQRVHRSRRTLRMQTSCCFSHWTPIDKPASHDILLEPHTTCYAHRTPSRPQSHHDRLYQQAHPPDLDGRRRPKRRKSPCGSASGRMDSAPGLLLLARRPPQIDR